MCLYKHRACLYYHGCVYIIMGVFILSWLCLYYHGCVYIITVVGMVLSILSWLCLYYHCGWYGLVYIIMAVLYYHCGWYGLVYIIMACLYDQGGVIGKHQALSRKVMCNFREVLTRVESTEYSWATTVVYTQEYPTTLPMVGIGQMSRLNARCLPIIQSWPCFYVILSVFILSRLLVFTCTSIHVSSSSRNTWADIRGVCGTIWWSCKNKTKMHV